MYVQVNVKAGVAGGYEPPALMLETELRAFAESSLYLSLLFSPLKQFLNCFVSVCKWVHTCVEVRRWLSQFSLSTLWVLGVKFMLSHLVANTFTSSAVSQALIVS